MPTKEQTLRALADHNDYPAAADALGISPGQAYLVATGLPSDGSDSVAPGDYERPATLTTSTQHLSYAGASAQNPVHKPEVDAWIKRRAQADVAMREAARARDAAPGEVLEADKTEIGDVLTRQHDQVTALLKELKTIPGVSAGGSEWHQSRRVSIADMVTVALSKHESTEQEHFWPWVRSVLPDGDSLAQTALEQEQQGKDILGALGEVPPGEEDFDRLVEQLEASARKHVAFEDRVLLAVARATGEKDRTEVGRRFLAAHAHAPTRSHPHAPEQPAVAVKAAGAVSAVMGRARDKAEGRAAKRRGRAEGEPEPVADDLVGGPETTNQ